MGEEPQIKLANSAKWHGGDRWAWEVWVEAPPERIQEIEKVEYILHPTFSDRLQKVSDAESKFRLSGRGWGEFMIRAKAQLKSGQTVQLNHWLKFKDSEAGLRSMHTDKPTLFLSYSRADYPVAAEVRRFCEARGLEVITSQDSEPEESVTSSTRSMLGKADALIAVMADDPSLWLIKELMEARAQQLVTVLILLGSSSVLPSPLSGAEFVRIENPNDHKKLIQVVEQELKKINL